MIQLSDSFYTVWLMIQSIDTTFKSECFIPSTASFVSQQVKFLYESTHNNFNSNIFNFATNFKKILTKF